MKSGSVQELISLGEFLRARRERLTPQEVGLPSYGRRRTPGLRREEVAQLAHIGTSWYTALEQGKVSNPSDQVLNSLAEALRLSVDERRHLYRLVKSSENAPQKTNQEITPGLERMVFALDPHPSIIINCCWDMLLWNKAAELVFRLPVFSKEVKEKPNWLRRFLLDPAIRTNNPDWEEKARVMIARFRADYAHFQQDSRFHALIEACIQKSDVFRAYWPKHDVESPADCHKRWTNPIIGEMEFEYMTLYQALDPALKIMIYTASPSTAQRLNEWLSRGTVK